jgi:hypothetical protein
MTSRLIGTLCLVIAGMGAYAEAGQGRGRGAAAPTAHRHDASVHATTSIHFEVDHVRVIRAHYGPRFRQLPPGLQKKYARTGELPPGWQKKMEPFPVAIERDLPPLPAGYGRGIIDGHAVIFSSRTGVIVDVAVLF